MKEEDFLMKIEAKITGFLSFDKGFYEKDDTFFGEKVYELLKQLNKRERRRILFE